VAALNGPSEAAAFGQVVVSASALELGAGPAPVGGLVLAAGVAVVHQEEGDRVAGVLGAGAVVEAERLVDREEVVVPAALDQQRRRRLRVVDVIGGVVGGDLGDDRGRQRVRVVGLAGVDQPVPGGEIGAGVGSRKGVVAGREAGAVEPGHVGGLLDPDRRFSVGAPVGVVGAVVEGAAVRHQRVGEVAPGPLRHRRGEFHLRAGRAFPRGQGAVGKHRPVAQRRQRHRHAAAVGDAGGADLVRDRDAFVGEDGDQVLGVADLVAGVEQVVVAGGAGFGFGDAVGVLAAAALAPAAVADAEDGVARFGPVPHPRVPEADLAAAPAVEDADQRVRPVGAGARRRRQDDVDVDLRLPVPGRGLAAAEADVPVRGLRSAAEVAAVEGGEVGARRGHHDQSRENRRRHHTQHPPHLFDSQNPRLL
jgi:hypothetical protein